MRQVLILVLLCLGFVAQATDVPTMGFTEEESQAQAEANARAAFFSVQNPTLFTSDNPLSFQLIDETTATAYAEYHEAGYLIISSNFDWSSRHVKMALAENLPEGVKLVVFTGSRNKKQADAIKDSFANFIDRDRIIVIYMPNAHRGFWARDSVPVPVFRYPKAETGVELFTVVDARYSRFEQDERFKFLYGAEMTRYNYFFEGGNFIANSTNHCLVVNKTATAQMPDRVFLDHYGCKELTRLPHVKGIGHADESVKFIDEKTVLTDEASYIPILKEKGYEVVVLPRPNNRYETYVNSLIINGTVWVPVFGQSGDEAALDVYREQGFDKVIGVNTSKLSNEGLGSIHCITMTYPPVAIDELLDSIHGIVIQ